MIDFCITLNLCAKVEGLNWLSHLGDLVDAVKSGWIHQTIVHSIKSNNAKLLEKD